MKKFFLSIAIATILFGSCSKGVEYPNPTHCPIIVEKVYVVKDTTDPYFLLLNFGKTVNVTKEQYDSVQAGMPWCQ